MFLLTLGATSLYQTTLPVGAFEVSFAFPAAHQGYAVAHVMGSTSWACLHAAGLALSLERHLSIT